MNERIQALEIQCWDRQTNHLNTEKFTQMIVQECLAIVNRKEYSYHKADPLWETAQLIKEHFGVGL